MRKHWTWLLLVSMIVSGLLIGCDENDNILVTDEETLCGKVISIKENTLVLEVGTVEELFEFLSGGEEKSIAIAENAAFSTMTGIKKTTATVKDVEVGDILAVTMSAGKAATIVIHPKELLEETS